MFGSDEEKDEDEQQTIADVSVTKMTLFQNGQSEEESTGDEVSDGEKASAKHCVSCLLFIYNTNKFINRL